MNGDILVRLDGARGVITIVKSDPFFENDDLAAVYNAAFREYSTLFAAILPPIGSLAMLGSWAEDSQ